MSLLSMRLLFILLFISFLSFSCYNKTREKSKKTNFIVIQIQPFTGITKQQTSFITGQLKNVYPHITVAETVDLPSFAYFKTRNRYKADSILKYLDNITPDDYVTIGIANKDISTTKNNIDDWGIMGLGNCPGKSCIASSFRLKNSNMQLYKVAIHELGHTQGLTHCTNKSCFMRDAEGGNPLDAEKDFCKACKQILKVKGWSFN